MVARSEDIDWVAHFAIPQEDPAQPPPVVRWPTAREAGIARMQGLIRRLAKGGRLAYVDSHFPWRRSGFRYSDALGLYHARPDTLFFSSYKLTDPFPAPVHPLADFPRIASAAGVTDVYAVFLLFLQGLCGLGPYARAGSSNFMEGPDLWRLLRRRSLRVHGTIYPGGGFSLTEHSIAEVLAVSKRLTTTFSFIPELLERVPDIVEIPQALTDTTFYGFEDCRWDRMHPLTCLFAADSGPRKGFDAALGAMGQLGAGFHLHVAGPHQYRRHELPHRATFHGWLSPEALRRLHAECHVFLSPVRAERPGPPGSTEGVVDGFPTQAAADAMSSGCLLISSNPCGDHRVLTPGEHYIECGPDSVDVAEALRAVAADPAFARRVARQGSDQVRRRMAVGLGIDVRLQYMTPPPAAAVALGRLVGRTAGAARRVRASQAGTAAG